MAPAAARPALAFTSMGKNVITTTTAALDGQSKPNHITMIGAIVAEFFGTPVVGMGFRINTEVGRMNIDMVWATIVVAGVVGSVFYGVVALIERQVTFWHASYRQRPA